MGVNEIDGRAQRRGAASAIRALAWLALLLSVYGLYVALGNAGHGAARWWISSDSLYPVHVFIDTVLDGNSFSGWRFSVAPCWFPDMFLSALFMVLTRNPIVATLLAGFIQIFLLIAGISMLGRATGWRLGTLPEVGALAAGCVAALRLAATPAADPGLFGQFFLPQTHVGSLLLTVYALALAVRILRSAESGEPLKRWEIAAYAAVCLLGGVSDLMFVVQTLVPMTPVLAIAVAKNVLRKQGAAVLLAAGWLPAAIGYAINALLLNTTPVISQTDRRLVEAFRTFAEGFLSSLARLDLFHLGAITWTGFALIVLWRGLRPGRDLRTRLIAVALGTLGLAALSSVGAVIAGGSKTLTIMNNYPATLRYLHPAFLLPIVALPYVFFAMAETRWRNPVLTQAVAGVLVFCVLLPSLSAARRKEPGATPFSHYNHPVGELLDGMAPREGLKHGVAGYWQARPITLLSDSGVRAYAVTPGMEPFLWVSNTEWYRQVFNGSRPQVDFVVLDDPLFRHDAPPALKAFGEPARVVNHQGVRVLLYQCKTCSLPADERAKIWFDEPLSRYAQQLTADVKQLELAPGKTATLRLTVTNPGTDAWASSGRWPVNLAYRIFRGDDMITEGERARLPGVLPGGASADVEMRVTAPAEPGQYVVRISAVQEAVAWFVDKGAHSLEVPLTVR